SLLSPSTRSIPAPATSLPSPPAPTALPHSASSPSPSPTHQNCTKNIAGSCLFLPPHRSPSAHAPDSPLLHAPPSLPSASPSTLTYRSHTRHSSCSAQSPQLSNSSPTLAPSTPSLPSPLPPPALLPPFLSTSSSLALQSAAPPVRCLQSCSPVAPPDSLHPAARTLLPPSKSPAAPPLAPSCPQHISPLASPASLPASADNAPTDWPVRSVLHS